MMYLGESNPQAGEGPGQTTLPTHIVLPQAPSPACIAAQKKVATAQAKVAQISAQITGNGGIPNISALQKLPGAQKDLVHALANAQKACSGAISPDLQCGIAGQFCRQNTSQSSHEFDFKAFFQAHKEWFVLGGAVIGGLLLLSMLNK